jgi:serine/threonine-protein kinase
MAQINEAPPELPAIVAEPVRNLVFTCIAKNPADRPSSAAHLARAAQALRRGDVRAAAASVPAILGAAAATDTATVLMTSPGGAATQATAILPSAAGQSAGEQTTDEEAEEKKRSPWTWPLIALIALLVLVLIGTIIALLVQPNGKTPAASTSTTQSAPSTTPTPVATTTPTSTTAQIAEGDFVGLTADQARQRLDTLGMVTDVQTGSAATDSSKVSTVYSVNPTGPVPKGTTVTVKVYGPVTPIPTPGDSVTVHPPSGQGTANSQIVVSFGSAICPAGQNLIGRALYINGQKQTPVNDTKFTWSPSSAGDYSLTYTIFCNQGESVESAQSAAADYKVLPATGPVNPPSSP